MRVNWTRVTGLVLGSGGFVAVVTGLFGLAPLSIQQSAIAEQARANVEQARSSANLQRCAGAQQFLEDDTLNKNIDAATVKMLVDEARKTTVSCWRMPK